MPRRSRRRPRAATSAQRRKGRPRSAQPPAAPARAAAPSSVVSFPRPVGPAPGPARVRAPTRDYAYVAKEVRRIAIATAGIVVLLIVFTVILR
jgi:hypothetical protein